MKLSLYLFFLFSLSFSLGEFNEHNPEPEIYEELVASPSEDPQKLERVPHHPGISSSSRLSPHVHHIHRQPRSFERDIPSQNQRPPHPGGPGIPQERMDFNSYNEFQNNQGPIGSPHRRGGPIHHQNMQNYHNNHPQQSVQYSSHNNSNTWFSGTLGTIYEIMMIFFLVGLVYNCVLGRNQNDKHALAWYNANKQYFEERYESIGLEKNEIDETSIDNKLKDSVIIKESPYFYKFYCSNYRYIKWSLTALEFRRRYDATSLIAAIFFPSKDRLVYEVSFNPVEPLGWVFCVCKKRDISGLRKTYSDIEYFTKPYEPSVMSERMCLLSENKEVFMELFNNKNLFPYYKQVEEFLELIYYTDQSSFSKEPFVVFFSFDINLTIPNQDRRLLEITHFVNLFVDTLAQLKYSQKFKNDVKNSRIMLERTKMEEGKRKEIEEKEKRDFIEKWKIKNKMKNKKGAERRKLMKELEKYE